MTLERLVRPVVFETPEHPGADSGWHEHVPFAFWTVDAVRPSVVVELGTQSGVSYCAFCQAVKFLRLPTKCFAVDTWSGDDHTGKYGDHVLTELKLHHDPKYGSFSTLVRSTFAEAARYFDAGSVDVLHIDGFHTYGAVKEDFETWKDKLSARAVVLFHDVNVRERDFGAWKFWNDIRSSYPSFDFVHGYGLGVLAVGPDMPEDIRWLVGLADAEASEVRRFFAQLGAAIRAPYDIRLSETRRMEAEAGLRKAAADVGTQLESAREAFRQAGYRDGLIAEREQTIALRDRAIAEQNSVVLDLQRQLIQVRAQASDDAARLERSVADRDAALDRNRKRMAAQESQLLAREHAYMVERNQHLAVIQISQARIASFEASISWKVTAPLRQVKRWGQLCRRLIRRRHCDLRAVPAADVPNALRPVGESLHWFDLVPNGGGLPTGWALVSLTADVEGTTVYPILAIYYGVGDWRPMSLPPVVGTLEDHILRLPDHVGGLMLAFVFADSRPVPKPPKLRLVEVGQIEVGLRTVSRHRHRLRGALHFLRIHGYRAALARAANIHLPKDFDAYERWIAVYDSLSPDDVDAIEAHIEALPSKPTISVVVPVYNTEESHLRQMIDSVLTQIYPHWELCIADDASTAPHVREVLADYERRDSRIKVVLRQRNGHISAASNSALELVSGPYVALLDHDDVLTPHALYLAAVAVNEHPDADIVYSDEDKIDGNGRRYGPYFKPDWNFELLLGQNYVSHFGVYRTSAVREVGGFRLGYEGSQDYDLVLRIAGRTRGPIVHVPFVLYHWRIFSGATTFSSKQFETATMAARRALADYFASRGEKVEVKPAIGGFHKVVYKLPEILPEVSVIVPTRDQADLVKICVRGVVQGTDYPNLEVIVVNNDSREDDALSYFAELRSDTRVRVVDYPGEFNYSGINNTAAREAAGDILVFLNNDIEVVSSDWLKEMVRLAVRPAIGAVGAKLLYHDKTVQHGGIVLGLGGIAGHLYDGYAQEETGYLGRLHLRQGMSCVSAACLAMRKSVFDEVGGFDEENLKVAYNDVDLCLKIGEKGYQVVWTPEAQLLHWGSKSRGSDRRSRHADRRDKEVEHMWSRWGDKLKHDPLFSPNLSLTSPYPDLAFPPRRSKPWAAYLPKVPNPSLPTLKI